MVVIFLNVITAKGNPTAYRIFSLIAAGILTIFRFTTRVVFVAT